MKKKTVISLSVLLLLSGALPCSVRAEEGAYEAILREFREKEAQKALEKREAEAAKQPKSIWDDKSEANPYFKSNVKKKTAATKENTAKKRRSPKRRTFKRRVYTGPSKEEIASAAVEKSTANFNGFFASGDYDVKYDGIQYDVRGDTLTVKKLSFVPRKKDGEKKKIPYLMKAGEVVLRNMNIGEKNGTPLKEDGEMTVLKMEIPIWNEEGVKKGKIDVSQLRMTGDLAAYLKGGAVGKLKTLEAKDVRSEKIINETVLNNVIRSKVFSASDVALKDVVLNEKFLEALKQQDIDGVSFSSAQIDGTDMPTLDGVRAAMLSYSARIVNTDLVFGARLEAQKEQPAENVNPELLKQNVAENKAEIEKAVAEALE